MKAYRRQVGQQVYFGFMDADPKLHDTLRRLYYREFEDGFAKAFPADTPELEQLYDNFARLMPELILQAAGVVPVPWERCLEALLERLHNQGFDWWLVGSAALAVRGLPVNPHDLDLVVQGQESSRLSALLRDCEVEPLQNSSGWIWDWFGRCFLYARLEWVGDVNAKAEAGGMVDYGPTALAESETVTWHRYPVRVPPLTLQLAVSERRGLTDRARLIRSAIENPGVAQL